MYLDGMNLDTPEGVFEAYSRGYTKEYIIQILHRESKKSRREEVFNKKEIADYVYKSIWEGIKKENSAAGYA